MLSESTNDSAKSASIITHCLRYASETTWKGLQQHLHLAKSAHWCRISSSNTIEKLTPYADIDTASFASGNSAFNAYNHMLYMKVTRE